MTDSTLDLVVNPLSRWVRRGRLHELCRSLEAAGTTPTVTIPGSSEEAAEVLGGLARSERRTAVVGGDGTLNLAVGAFTGGSTPLGIVAAGTGNDFAREIGLGPSDDPQIHAARLLGTPRPVDVLAVSSSHDDCPNRRVATVATCGFSVEVNERAERMRFVRGSMRYTLATILQSTRMAPVQLDLAVDGTVTSHRAVLVAVANTRAFGGGMLIAPDADPGDGLADVVVIGEVGRLELLRLLPTAFSGRHIQHPAVTVLRGARVEIMADIDRRIRGDGEYLTTGPAVIEVLPGALEVCGARW